jgi:mannose-6-phosphate isomerase-like protein (cupin superfamily)
MPNSAINFSEKFGRFSERWSPRIVAQMNDYHFKLVKILGEFIWHTHPETDEVFVVLDGEMTIHLRDGDVALRAGEMFVVPRGVEHKPSATRECRMMLIEPAGTLNTGDAQSERTAPDGVWV